PRGRGGSQSDAYGPSAALANHGEGDSPRPPPVLGCGERPTDDRDPSATGVVIPAQDPLGADTREDARAGGTAEGVPAAPAHVEAVDLSPRSDGALLLQVSEHSEAGLVQVDEGARIEIRELAQGHPSGDAVHEGVDPGVVPVPELEA